MSDVTITCRPNGPLLVSGQAKLIDTAGNTYDLSGKASYALCRCNDSKNKPFCDGSHKTCGFTAAETAPAT
ncbi:MAG: CDGSH iron-sulfur domain-containing protein [Planctomycetaceae bacterium]